MDPAQTLLGGLDSLANRGGDFLGLAYAEADHLRRWVADHYQSRKAQVLAALDHLGDPVDGDHLLLEVERRRIDAFH
jgi:hypothetical protein